MPARVANEPVALRAKPDEAGTKQLFGYLPNPIVDWQPP
jgi:hypothetical protein